MVPDLAPMLADRGMPSGGLEGWAVEPKLDGWRVTVAVHAGRVTVRTRRGHVITGSVPGIEALAGLGVDVLLDGELVAGAGRASDFYALMPHVARRPGATKPPLSFWAFDLLFHDGVILTGSAYWDRRLVLEALTLPEPCRVLPRWPATDTADLLVACGELDVEGVVLKRLRSIYRPGERSRHWRKVKSPGWADLHAQRRAPV
jgi:bifunctional non-homologous end joining protein LigD